MWFTVTLKIPAAQVIGVWFGALIVRFLSLVFADTEPSTHTDMKYLIIMNIFERVADNADSHVDQVRGGHLEDLLRELLAVLVDLLHTETYRHVNIVLRILQTQCLSTLFYGYLQISQYTNLHSQMGNDGSLVSLQCF